MAQVAECMRQDQFMLGSSKVFGTVSHNILTGKLRKRGLDEGTVRWTGNWLIGRAQGVLISSAESSWRPAATCVPQGIVLGVAVFKNLLSMTWMKQQSVPSTSLLMIWDLEEWLIPQKAMLPPSKTWTGDLGAEQPSEVLQRQCQILNLRKNNSPHQDRYKAALWRKTWGSWWTSYYEQVVAETRDWRGSRGELWR